MSDVKQFQNNKLPEGWTPWFGCASPAGDYINGPVYLRDGTVTKPNKRIAIDQWFWTTHATSALYGEIEDDIIGYMPGYVKSWEFGEEAPEDWVVGAPVLWGDNTVWSDGLTKQSIGWNKGPGAMRSSIVAYVSTDTPPVELESVNADRAIRIIRETLMSFPALGGRVTDGHAQHVYRALNNFEPVKLVGWIDLHKSYLTRDDTVVTLTNDVSPDDEKFAQGFRFISDRGQYYMPSGFAMTNGVSMFDLIKQVGHPLHEALMINRQGIVDELGYIAASGQMIRAIKLYRSVFGVGLTEAKQIITAAASLAISRYQIPNQGSEAEKLRDCLRHTRRLISLAAAEGLLTDELFKNQAVITKLVPLRPVDRESTLVDMVKYENKSDTLVDHTYKVGDKIQWRSLFDRVRDQREGKPTIFTILEIEDVPPENIEYNSRIPEEVNETGVGHHQLLIITEGGRKVSGARVELV